MTALKRIVYLKCESEHPSFDQRVRRISVEHEDNRAWYGAPIDNPACPALEWPKCAWKIVGGSCHE